MASETDVRWLRRKLGDTSARAFSDAELNDLLGETPNRNVALADGLWELLTVVAKWNSYTVGIRRESKDEIFKNMFQLWQVVDKNNGTSGVSGTGGATQQVGIIDMMGSEISRPTRDYSLLLLDVSRF